MAGRVIVVQCLPHITCCLGGVSGCDIITCELHMLSRVMCGRQCSAPTMDGTPAPVTLLSAERGRRGFHERSYFQNTPCAAQYSVTQSRWRVMQSHHRRSRCLERLCPLVWKVTSHSRGQALLAAAGDACVVPAHSLPHPSRRSLTKVDQFMN